MPYSELLKLNLGLGLGDTRNFNPQIEVARLDGATKYWVFDVPVVVPLGGSVEIDLLYDPNTTIDNDYILCSEASTSTSSFFLSREAIGVGSSGIISEYTIDEQASNNFPYDNSFHTIKYIFDNDLGRVKFLGTRFNIQQLSRGIFKNFRVRDGVGSIVNEILLTNKSQGATQLATVGSINATMINYTGDEWERLP